MPKRMVRSPATVRDCMGGTYDSTTLFYTWTESIREDRFSALSREEERKLLARWQLGRDISARDELLERNLRFITFLAGKFKGYGVDQLDLIQEGVLGFLHAIDKFDPTYPFKLISYASNWIRSYFHKCIASQRAFRLPGNILSTLARVQKIRRKWYSQYGEYPTPEEISEKTGIPERAIKSAMSYLKLQSTSSTETPIYEGKNGGVLNLGSSFQSSTLNPETLLLAKETIREINDSRALVCELLCSYPRLSERQRNIFSMHYGLGNGGGIVSMKQCGEKIGVTREAVRQSVERTLGKLRRAGLPKEINDEWLLESSERLRVLESTLASF